MYLTPAEQVVPQTPDSKNFPGEQLKQFVKLEHVLHCGHVFKQLPE
jgi:hypothetical protein